MIDATRKIEDTGLNEKELDFCKRDGVQTVGDFLNKYDELRLLSEITADEIYSRISTDSADGEKQIVYIPVDSIIPHPNNPRKDVGDVSELAESIKANGIMQNLTVVPAEGSGKYYALIGHRRLAAAKQAGLEKVPCVVTAGLDLSEQVSIMLAENMQRKDLTDIEEMDGIQMMFDLGDTVSSIATKTGLSESTIRKRRKLTEYNREDVISAYERGATFADFDKINAIKDPEKRKELVALIGTNNFEWKLNNFLNDQKRLEFTEEAKAWAEGFARCVKSVDYSAYNRVMTIYSKDNLKMPKDYDESREYVYTVGYYVEIFVKRVPHVETAEEAAAREAREAANKELDDRKARFTEIFEAMKKRRVEFVQDFKGFPKCTAAKELDYIYTITEILICAETDGECGEFDLDDFAEFFDIELPEDVPNDGHYALELMNGAKISGARKTLLYAYFKLESGSSAMYDYCLEYRKDNQILYLYELLKVCGFVISDEERAVLDGTHELYTKENKGNDR